VKEVFSKEKIFEKILESLTDGLMVFDKEKRLFLVNPTVKKFFGFGEEILGKKINEFAELPGLEKIFYLLGEKIEEFSKRELEINENLILEVTSLALFEGGEKIGNLVILHDVTREKKIEKTKTEFVSLSAHQLRTPLAALRWSLEGLGAGKLDKEQKDLVQKAKDSTQRMLALVDELLNVVKIEEGVFLGKLIPSDLLKIVEEVVEGFREEIKRKKIKFELNLPSKKLPKIKVDPQKIFIVIQNLLDNAIRYNFPGGIVKISLDFDQKEMKFSISDTGIGIPESEQENVFKRFFRASNALKFETEGNGIGLYLAKNIVEAHGGKIWFESKENKGTTFYFTLPLK